MYFVFKSQMLSVQSFQAVVILLLLNFVVAKDVQGMWPDHVKAGFN